MPDRVPTLARDAASQENKVGAVDFALCSLIGSRNRMNGRRSGLHGGQAQQLLFFGVLQLYLASMIIASTSLLLPSVLLFPRCDVYCLC